MVKSSGFKVKLDTNGTRPRVLRDLLDKRLLDYVAVDIKAPPGKYNRLAGVAVDYGTVAGTIDMLRENQVEHEFRTTFVPGLLDMDDIVDIAEVLKGCRRYVIQRFKPNVPLLNPALESISVPERGEIEEPARRCQDFVNVVELRGF